MSTVTLPAEVSFQTLGKLPGSSSQYSKATAVSADGTVVVGFSHNADLNTEAFRWVKDGSMTGLGILFGAILKSEATAVSADGSKVAGNGDAAVFWWENDTLSIFADSLTSGFFQEAFGMSADGSVVVGTNSSMAYNKKAVRCEGGIATSLGVLNASDTTSTATAVSSDGSVVVGFSQGNSGVQAFRWENGTMTGLPYYFVGDNQSRALGISPEGNVIVGYSFGSSGRQAVRWFNGSAVALAQLDGSIGYRMGTAYGASSDGKVVVGSDYDSLGMVAVFWSEGNGYAPVSLNAFLDANTINRNGFTLLEATAVSADGTTVVGYGTNAALEYEAFRVQMGDVVQAWLGYPFHSDGRSVDTGDFLGWIDVGDTPWIYVYGLNKYVYGPEEYFTESGGWLWIGP